jgi:hypothetical protein
MYVCMYVCVCADIQSDLRLEAEGGATSCWSVCMYMYLCVCVCIDVPSALRHRELLLPVCVYACV